MPEEEKPAKGFYRCIECGYVSFVIRRKPGAVRCYRCNAIAKRILG